MKNYEERKAFDRMLKQSGNERESQIWHDISGVGTMALHFTELDYQTRQAARRAGIDQNALKENERGELINVSRREATKILSNKGTRLPTPSEYNLWRAFMRDYDREFFESLGHKKQDPLYIMLDCSWYPLDETTAELTVRGVKRKVEIPRDDSQYTHFSLANLTSQDPFEREYAFISQRASRRKILPDSIPVNLSGIGENGFWVFDRDDIHLDSDMKDDMIGLGECIRILEVKNK